MRGACKKCGFKGEGRRKIVDAKRRSPKKIIQLFAVTAYFLCKLPTRMQNTSVSDVKKVQICLEKRTPPTPYFITHQFYPTKMQKTNSIERFIGEKII